MTDSQNRVLFVPDTNAAGSAYATFSYALSRNSGAQSVAVSILALAHPTPTTPRVQATEDQSVIFQLTSTDPNPAPGGGTVSYIIDFPSPRATSTKSRMTE